MICDNQTNTVYFSSKLQEPPFTEFCNNLVAILNKHNITHHFLDNTNDIWCRDYMPVQVREDKFVEYVYDPDYLKKEYSHLRSEPSVVCRSAGIKTFKTDIILDGGNVVRYGNRVIMTDKIFWENSHYTREALTGKLADLFESDIVIIPWDRKYERRYGHADGLVRFIDENTVLVNNWNGFHNQGEKALRDALISKGLTFKTLEYKVQKPDNKNWGYLNFLQMKGLLLIPVFGIDEDSQAVAQFHQIFLDYSARNQVETIESNVIIEEEGVLNCVSWNIIIQHSALSSQCEHA